MSSSSSYPYKWVELSEAEKNEKRKLFGGCEMSLAVEMVCSEPDGILMPKPFAKIAEDLYNFELRSDDIWLVTYPKCGTTWTQETLWQIVNGFDPTQNNGQGTSVRSPFLEFSCLLKLDPNQPDPPVAPKESMEHMVDSLNYAKKMKSPRVIKSHMPFEFLPPKLLDTCKVVFVSRNVKDTCVSFFHHYNISKPIFGYTGDFPQYAELFKNGELEYGSFWFHLKSALKRKNHPNLTILWYEDIKRNHMSILKDLCSFTDYPMSDEKLEQLKQFLSIDNMREKAMASMSKDTSEADKNYKTNFYRKGLVGDWKNFFQGEMGDEWDQWIKENLEGTGIDMKFE